MDKVSIITTFYNCENFLNKAISSVIKQQTNDLINIEYILVNDCSVDNSLYIAQEFIDEFKDLDYLEIKLFTPEANLGCGGARKFGIEQATGDYFMFLDADDYYINDDFVLRAYQTIIDELADIVEYGVIYNDTSGHQQNLCVGSRQIFDNNHDALY